ANFYCRVNLRQRQMIDSFDLHRCPLGNWPANCTSTHTEIVSLLYQETRRIPVELPNGWHPASGSLVQEKKGQLTHAGKFGYVTDRAGKTGPRPHRTTRPQSGY